MHPTVTLTFAIVQAFNNLMHTLMDGPRKQVMPGSHTEDPKNDHAVRSGIQTLALQNILCMRSTKTYTEHASDFHVECVH